MVKRVVKQHKKIFLTILFVFIFTIVSPMCIARAEDDNPTRAMFPSIKTLFNGQNDSKYLEKYRDNYYLDLKESGVFKSFDLNILNTIANGVFKMEAILSYVVIIVVFYAFELNLYDIFSPFLNTVTQSFKTGIFDELALACISLLGIFYVIKMVRDQKTQVWIAIIQTITIIVISMWFLNNPAGVLKGVNDFSLGISHSILDGTYKSTNNGESSDSATIAVSNNLWQMFVHKPWQLLEFGNTELAEKHEDKILSLAPGSKERQTYINDIAKDGTHFQPGWGLDRLVIVLLYFIIFIVMAAVILLFSALMLVYEILTIVIAMFGVFVFLIALVPWWGMRTLREWFSKILGYSCMKIALSFFLAVSFSFMLATYTLSNKYSIFVIMLIQVIIIVAIWWKRNSLLELFISFTTSSRKLHEGPQHINKLVKKDINVERAIRNKFGARGVGSNPRLAYSGGYGNSGGNGNSGYGGSSNVGGTGGNLSSSGINSGYSNGSSGNNGGSSNSGNGSYGGSSSPINSGNQGANSSQNGSNNPGSNGGSNNGGNGGSNNSNNGASNNGNQGSNLNSGISSNKGANNSNSQGANSNDNSGYDSSNIFGISDLTNSNKDSSDLKELLKIAEEILESKYEESKSASEEKADKMNKAPEYSYFVEKVMNREKMNLPRFEEREKLAVVNQIKSVVENGGRIEDLYGSTSEANENQASTNKVERPKQVVIEHDETEEITHNVQIEVESDIEAGEDYTREFNKEFDKKYDVKFMENLIKKYGRENVKTILNEMKRINSTEKINNPAGYMTKSLKNNYINGESIRNKGGDDSGTGIGQ